MRNKTEKKSYRKIVSGIFEEGGNILVVDKLKDNGNILTILPGGKNHPNETDADCLLREVKEEFGIVLDRKSIGEKIGSVVSESPTSKIESEVQIIGIKDSIDVTKIELENILSNPRYISPEEILISENTTTLTQKSILEYLGGKELQINIGGNIENIFICGYNQKIYILLGNFLYVIKNINIKTNKITSKMKNGVIEYVTYLENNGEVFAQGSDENESNTHFIKEILKYIKVNKITPELLNKMIKKEDVTK